MKKAMLTMALMALVYTLFGQQTHWTKADGFENNMNMSAVLYVDGTAQHLDQVELGAFCGDECREAVLPYDIDGEMVYLMTILGNAGDMITFRLWDHQTDSELVYECATFYSFVANEVVGEYPDWYPIQFTIPDVVYEITATANPEEGGTVTGDGTYYQDATAVLVATAAEGYAFVNWTENGEVVSTETAYSFAVTGDRVLVAHFEVTEPIGPDPNAVVIELNPGWNWISYLPRTQLTVEEAFANLTPNDGDMIKAQNTFATYDAALGRWKGSLVNMVPGKGYIYLRKGEATTFVYPQ